ncbi:MAG TPA: transporter [Verrucomicrobiales bacterium]|nr:transporter [Verrucomicrobiales bacterium]
MEAPETLYGSDEQGLVWGFVFTPGEPARQIDCVKAADLLSMGLESEKDNFVWLHFSLSNASTVPWLKLHLALPDAFYDDLHETIGATRVEQNEDTLVAVVHDILFDFVFDPSSIATLRLCIGHRFMISARLRPLRSVDRLRASVRAGTPFRSPVELLADLMHDQADVLVQIIRRTTIKVDQIEDNLLANRVSSSRSELSNLRRLLVRLQRLLAPEPAALFRLLNRPPGWIVDADLQGLREASEEFSTAVQDTLALTERIKILQEELSALVTEQSSRTLFVLTVVTVLALPVNLVAGLFGMNVGGIPLAEHGHGFFIIVTILFGLTTFFGVRTLWRREK